VNTDATLIWIPDLGSSDHGSNPARLAATALSTCWCCWRWMAVICASSRRTSASESAPGAGRNAAGTGWAGATGRGGSGPAGATAAEEPAADGTLTATGELLPATGEDVGGAAGIAVRVPGTPAAGAEAPQPEVSVAVRSSATAVALAAQVGGRDPDIGGLWAQVVVASGSYPSLETSNPPQPAHTPGVGFLNGHDTWTRLKDLARKRRQVVPVKRRIPLCA
jgi:hypothetical protein